MLRLLATIISCIAMTHGQSAIIGAYGGSCVNGCLRRGYSYAWCATTSNGWDYCSAMYGITSYGRVCRGDHSCATHGYSYRWCYTDFNNNWDYCSTYGSDYRRGNHLTRYGYYCINACRRHDNYFYCDFIEGGGGQSWEYCSLERDFDRYGNQCNLDHYCGTHGESYYWCYVGSGSWEYCSLKNDCGYYPSLYWPTRTAEDNHAINVTSVSQDTKEAKPSHGSKDKIIHTNSSKSVSPLAIGILPPISPNLATCEQPEFDLVPQADNSRERYDIGNNFRAEAFDLIETFNMDRFDSLGTRTLHTSTNFVLVQTGNFQSDGQTFIVLKIWVNSATYQVVANVQVPHATTIPSTYVKQAFESSLRTDKIVRITPKVPVKTRF